LKTTFFILFLLGFGSMLPAQSATPSDSLPQGAWARMEIELGDTTFVMSLRPVRVLSKRIFKDMEEQKLYYRYWRAAKKVYPYALQGIALYEELQEETEGMRKNKRKRHLRREGRELKEDFKNQMKNLTKTEGRVLIKMMEKELHKPFYDVLTETRGSMTASYWHNLGKMWGYNLKEGYTPGADPLLDEIFLDYDFGDPLRWYR
jgi:hypothetical protein